jgi:hypothetical protein
MTTAMTVVVAALGTARVERNELLCQNQMEVPILLAACGQEYRVKR